MLRLATSNRLEALVDLLAEALSKRDSPLEIARIVVPNRPVERFVELRLAQRLGIASGLEFQRLPALSREVLGGELLDEAEIEARCLALFAGETSRLPEPVRRWLEAGGPSAAARERRMVSLAARIASLFVEYDRTRPDLVRAWLASDAVPSGDLASWQAALLRSVRRMEPDRRTLAEASRQVRPTAPLATVHVLGISTAAPLEHAMLAALGAVCDVHVYALDPCREFWEDAVAPRALARQLAASIDTEDPASELPEIGLLGAWGRPAREHLVALRELAGWSATERWVEAAGTTVLGSLQRALLDRTAVDATAPDGSVRVSGCPSVRREVETVAREIWAALAEADARGAPMTFADVAVLLHDEAKSKYLPHVEAVFAEARGIPWSSRDLPFAGTSGVAQAALALVTLVSSEPSRALLFDVILSPVVLAGFPGATKERWQRLTLAVGFLRGLGEGDHAGTYVGPGAASLDLEQAIRRLALGALMPGEKSGEQRFVETDPPLLPEEIGESDEAALGLVALLRSLAGDIRFARTAQLSLHDWARFFSAMITAYVTPRSRGEEAELTRVHGAIGSLVARHREGTVLGIAGAAELVRAELGGATTQRGAPGVSGVAVGSLRALRSLPFRLVFVVGLGEGRFPSRVEESGLDVRDETPRRPGDVSAAERDRLVMLETVLATREVLHLSWVARAEVSGEPIAPSSVVLELLRELGPAAPPFESPPLRRHEGLRDGTLADRAKLAALPAALLEASARALGDRERDPGETWPRAAESVRGLGATDGLRTLLSWPKIEASAVEPTTKIEVTLAELRGFLERPLQVSAERALGRGEGELDDESEDEPLDADALARQRVVERSLELFLRDPRTPLALRVAHETEVLRARGRFPLGVLGDRERASLGRTAESLRERLAEIPGSGPLVRARLGRGRASRDGIERVSDPVVLGAARDGRPIELSGETGPLFDPRTSSVVVSARGAPGGRAGEARRTKVVLRTFVDHAALAAAGLSSGEPRTVWLVEPDVVHRVVLEPIEAALAMRWLRALAAELVAGSAAFLPVEAVLEKLDVVRGHSKRPADELHRAVERIREKERGGSERFGPVRDATLRDGLDPTALVRAVGARFGPFVEHARRPEPMERP